MYLIRRLFQLTFSRTMLVFLGLLALCGFIWYAGPLFAFSEYRPLSSERVRWWVICTIGALFLVWLLVRFWRRKKINAKLIDQLAKVKRSADEQAGAHRLRKLRLFRRSGSAGKRFHA